MPDLTTILASALGRWMPAGTTRSGMPRSERPLDVAYALVENYDGDETTVALAIVAAIPDAERDALEFGLAWLRVTRAKPDGWAIHLDSDLDLSLFRASTESFSPGRGQVRPFEVRYGPTPTAALTALAEALEARRG